MNYAHLVTVLRLISHNPSECRVTHIIAVRNFAMRRLDLWENGRSDAIAWASAERSGSRRLIPHHVANN